MPWDDGLNPSSPAYGIASDRSESIRVVAGPGTGKSFGLKRRVARLLETGISPARILPVTFTNVAAEEPSTRNVAHRGSGLRGHPRLDASRARHEDSQPA